MEEPSTLQLPEFQRQPPPLTKNNEDEICIFEIKREPFLPTTSLPSVASSLTSQGSVASHMNQLDEEERIRNRDINEINDDLKHEKTDKGDDFGFRIGQFLKVTFGAFYFCKKTAPGEEKPKWLYRYYAPFHIFYIVFCGFFFGTLFFVFELGSTKTNITYIDALLMSFANVCMSGFVTQPIQDITVASQVCLFFAIVSGGVTFTLIPVLMIKVWRARKRMFKLRKEGEHIRFNSHCETNQISLSDNQRTTTITATTAIRNDPPPAIPSQTQIGKLFANVKSIFAGKNDHFPLSDVEYSALLWLHSVTICLVLIINAVGFFILGGVFSGIYNEDKYLHGKSPFWLGLYFTVSAFNNCGSTLLDENLGNFVNDWVVCLTVASLIILGNILFPLVLRYTLVLLYKMSSRRKVVFKFMLEKHHHLSPYLFPGIQTTIYGIITIILLVIGITITLACDWDSPKMTDKSIATKILIAIFHPVSARNGGFNSIDLYTLSFPTLAFYIVMMYTKPQLACSLRENAYKIIDMVRHLNEEEKPTVKFANEYQMKKIKTVDTLNDYDQTPSISSSPSTKKEDVVFVKLKKKKSREQEAIEELEEDEKRVYSVNSVTTPTTMPHAGLVGDGTQLNLHPARSEKYKRVAKKGGKLMIKYISDFWFYFTSFLSTSLIWLFIIVFVISIAENAAMKKNPENFSIFFVLFEVMSAYANSGLTVGRSGSTLAYCGFWTTFSKVILCITLVMGRHRGFYGTLIDLEEESFDQDFKQHQELIERRLRLRKFKKQVKIMKRSESKRKITGRGASNDAATSSGISLIDP